MDVPGHGRSAQKTATDGETTSNPHYLKGFRDAINDLILDSEYSVTSEVLPLARKQSSLNSDKANTWGLQETGVVDSPFTGRGVKVAALVDGLDTSHPDWSSRHVILKSFVPGESPTDGGRSGTHYLGTAFGAKNPTSGPRYGCAPDASVHVAKVLGRDGGGRHSSIFAGLEWALAKECRIILLPVSWDSNTIHGIFDSIARQAFASGALLISGAGNNANRPTSYGHVLQPAACQYVISTGTIDRSRKPAGFTPRSSSRGAIDLVAPGVDLLSSVPDSPWYATWSGSATSAAFVAGIATLWAEALPHATAAELWQTLTSRAQRLELPTADTGAGLVRSPSSRVSKTVTLKTGMANSYQGDHMMPTNKSTELKIVVTVDDVHTPSIESVASELRLAGLKVTNVLATSGIITGDVGSDKISKLKEIKGVAAVEMDGEMEAN